MLLGKVKMEAVMSMGASEGCQFGSKFRAPVRDLQPVIRISTPRTISEAHNGRSNFCQ